MFGSDVSRPSPIRDLPYPPYRLLNMHYNEGGSSPIDFTGAAMLERDFQAKLIKEIKNRLPGSMVLKNDPNYKQGVPDLLVLHRDRWAALEVKASPKAKHRPNQDWYVSKMDDMAYAAFIDPSNKEHILDEVQRSLEA
nr:MAG TPA: Nuclease [Caudoviricetes sp.]